MLCTLNSLGTFIYTHEEQYWLEGQWLNTAPA